MQKSDSSHQTLKAMMKTINLLRLCLSGIALIAVIGCDMLRPSVVSKSGRLQGLPKVDNGYLVFESVARLTDLMRDFDSGLTTDEFENTLESIGFRSMNRYSNFLSQDFLRKMKKVSDLVEYDEPPSEIVEDYYFATILNEQGLVSIEGTIFRITHEYVFWINGDDPSQLLDNAYLQHLVNQMVLLKSASGSETNQCHIQEEPVADIHTGIHFIEVMRLGETAECQSDYSPEAGSLNRVEKRDYTSNPKRRVVAESWNTSWFIYASIGALTKNQKQSLWLYWKAPANKLGVQVAYSYEAKSCPGGCGHQNPVVIEEVRPWRYVSNTGSVKERIDMKTAFVSTNILKWKGAGTFKVNYIRSQHLIENPNRIELRTEWK